MGKEVNEPVKYQYLDFMCETNKEFGAKTPVPVSESTARSFAVHIDEVVYGDGTVENVNLDFSDSLPKQSILNETDGWNSDTAAEFRKLTGSEGKLMLTDYKDLWLCSCGCVNRADKDVKCRSCGVAYDLLKSVTPEKAQESIDEARYNEAVETMKNGDLSSYEEAIVIFRSLGDYKDSDEKITECENQIQEINIKNKKTKKIAAVVGAVICAVIALVAVIVNVIIPDAKYNNAVKLYEASEFDEAIDVFTNLDDYKDSADQIKNCKYGKAMSYAKEGKYDEAISSFGKVYSYKDSADQIKNCKYEKAIKLIEAKNYVDAYNILVELDDFKDCRERIDEISDQVTSERIKKAQIGDVIEFGSYEQDDYLADGKENITWIVLDKKDDSIFVVSKYALDNRQYNDSEKAVTWETSSLRKWLNNDFFNSAFTDKEKSMIPRVTVTADANPEYDTNPGNPTEDRVFLLSCMEFNYYSAMKDSYSVRYCFASKYAISNGADTTVYKLGYTSWWTRTPCEDLESVAYISGIGEISSDGCSVDLHNGVRPAMWITTSEG